MSMIIDPYRFAGASSGGYAAKVLSLPNLWGYWKLDEVSPPTNTTAADSSSATHPGTYSGTWTDHAALFSGSVLGKTAADRIALPNYTVGATPKFSIGGFIQTTYNSSTAANFLSADRTPTDRRFQFRMVSGKMQFITILPSVTTTEAPTAINDGNPHLVIMVFDESLAAGSGRVKIYIDGSLNVASTTSITVSPGNSYPAISSLHSANNIGPWIGQMDDMFFVDGAISSTDVSDLWAARNTL